jgi:glyoxylase-like metal-dependent hydrolase (beta-lactamase superfamily II)/rhodanese-related sulfurtransferase
VAGPVIDAFVSEGLGDSTYLLTSKDEAAVIDPQRDVQRVLTRAAELNARVTAVVETHVHNDYVSGALELRDRTGAGLILPAGGGYAFDHEPAGDGERIRIGGAELVAMSTPGHTPEHLAWIARVGEAPLAVFTGGSLMIGGAGRTDLLGPARTLELTRAQFRSLSRLRELPDEVQVLPTHGAGSFCGSSGPDGPRTSTVGAERVTNDALRERDAGRFVAARLTRLLEYPAYYRHMARVNRAGPPLMAELIPPEAFGPAELERAVAAGAYLVDGRPRHDFARAHIMGALNVELDEQFASYVGWLVPWNAPLALVLPDPQQDALVEALGQVRAIGFDSVIGHLAGGVAAWEAEGREVASYPTATIDELCVALHEGAAQVLDVRQPNEWADGIIPGSRTIFVADLPDRMEDVSGDGRTWITCRTGHRSAIAASLLDGAGHDVALVTPDGVPNVLERCAPDVAARGDLTPGPAGSR